MYDKYRELTGCEPDDASDIGIRLKLVAGELAELYDKSVGLEANLFPQTSSGEYLDKHADLKGIKRKPSQPSKGILEFYRPSPAPTDLVIPQYTVVSTSGANPVFYHTSNYAILKAGTDKISVLAESVEKGRHTNAAANSISNLVSAPVGISSVKNTTPFTGGTDFETDESLKGRVLTSYQNPSNSANASYYSQLALSIDGVKSVLTLPRNRGVGTVDVVVCSHEPSQQTYLVDKIRQLLNESREIGVDLKVIAATYNNINITVQLQTQQAYNFNDVASKCQTAVTEYLDNLEIGAPLLIAQLHRLLISISGVLNVKVVSPVDDIYSPKTSAIRAGVVKVNSWG